MRLLSSALACRDAAEADWQVLKVNEPHETLFLAVSDRGLLFCPILITF